MSTLLRTRGHGHARVTSVELFFDLVFVFAITQLSHALLHHLDALGAVQALLLFVAIWWAWINTAWVTNWLDPERAAVRLLLFALMLAGLVLSMSVPTVFGAGGLAFALAFVAAQLGRDLFMLWALGDSSPANTRNFQRILTWHAAASVFWLAGGFAGEGWRMAFWLLAVMIDTAAPALGFAVPGLGRSSTRDWTVEGGHMAERCGLFIIIALGESILVTGASFAELPWDAPHIGAFLAAFTGSVAMWWAYFHIGAERGAAHIAGSADPGRMARLGYTYLHLPIVAGIVLSAVGDEQVLRHPGGHATWPTTAVILGGPALFLAGLAAFKRLTLGWPPLSHSVGLGLLMLLMPLAPGFSPLLLSAAASGVLILVAGWEGVSLRRPVSA